MSEDRVRQPEPVQRRSARVVLVDQDDRVLLFSGDLPLPDGTPRTVWVLPGGGVEDTEDDAEAAVRELYEETGLRVATEELGKPVAVSGGGWSFRGIDYWSEEAFFFLRVPAFEVVAEVLTPIEQEFVTGHRWWSLDEIAHTDATIFPRELAQLLSRLLAGEVLQPPPRLSW